MGTLARFWGPRRQVVSTSIAESHHTIEAPSGGGRLARLELVFLHTARAGAGPLRSLLEECYGPELRSEYNSQPPQHDFESGEIKSWVDWVSRMIPNSGRALAANFLMQQQDIGYTINPVRFVTLVRDPLARLAGEFLAFRREIEARRHADAETREVAGDIVHFGDTMMRNNYLVRFFSSVDICDAIEDADLKRARAALTRLDVVGCHENPRPFARRLLSLDVFDRDDHSDARKTFAAEMSQAFRGPGDELASQLDAETRRRLERRNSHDLLLYHWIASELTHD